MIRANRRTALPRGKASAYKRLQREEKKRASFQRLGDHVIASAASMPRELITVQVHVVFTVIELAAFASFTNCCPNHDFQTCLTNVEGWAVRQSDRQRLLAAGSS